MKTEQITIEEFMSYIPLKPGVVHLHQGLIYKHSPNSQEAITSIEEAKAHPVFRHISKPRSILLLDDTYFGFTTKFNTKIHMVEDAECLNIIKDINDFIWKLIQIIEELNKLKLCYWDFHKNNIFSDPTGYPFLIDIDDIKANPTELNQYHQIKYLTEFILNILLNQEKTIQQYAKSETLEKYLSEKSINYIRTLANREGQPKEPPYYLIDDLSCTYKKELIKSKII